ncbi:MAG: FG-GAP-like repeat-containing protein [Ignavibacteria bacterium]|jgi:hypothetical protein
MRIILALIAVILSASLIKAQQFGRVDLNIQGLSHGKANWIDINSDGKLDFFAIGKNEMQKPVALLFLNSDSGQFIQLFTAIPGVLNGSAAWSDFDNDGDLDLLISGFKQTGQSFSAFTAVYVNELPSGFFNLNQYFPAVHSGSVSWVDYDNDSRKDIFLTGIGIDGMPVCRFFRNNGASFEEQLAPFPALYNSTAEWNDFDKDGDADLLLSGQRNEDPNSYLTRVYINTSGFFSESPTVLPQLSKGSAAFGDFDSDGHADIVLNGESNSVGPGNSNNILKIFHNEGNGIFEEHQAGIIGISSGKVIWADFDCDGFLDILATGNMENNASGMTRIFRNTGENFVEVINNLPDMMNGYVTAGDFDNDRKLDILMLGHNSEGTVLTTAVFRNLIPVINELPVEPKGLTTTFDNGIVFFNWLSGFDPATPGEGLSYNIRVGTSPGSVDIVSPESYGLNGFNRLPGFGNTGNSKRFHINGLRNGRYYWSVQTLDNSFGTSGFSAEESFVIANDSVGNITELQPEFELRQNYPNPFNPLTVISYKTTKYSTVKLKIFNNIGMEVTTLVNSAQNAGTYSVEFNANGMSSGIYFYSLEVNEKVVDSKRMILLK